MQQHSRIHALLATARVANLPSVVVNVWLGAVMAWVFGRCPVVLWSSVVAMMVVGICLYLAGNFFNDWMDRDWDARWRPERALPSGVFEPRTYGWLAVVMAGAGIGLAAVVAWQAVMVALMIAGCVIVYTVWHKRCGWAVIVMGMCRAGLVWLGASVVVDFSLAATTCLIVSLCAASLAILSYIAGLSWLARNESKLLEKSRVPVVSVGLFGCAAAAMVYPLFLAGAFKWVFLTGFLPYAIWLAEVLSPRVRGGKHRVSMLLAGIPLVDGMFLLPFAGLMIGDCLGELTMVIASAVVPPMAFIAALWLQRLAPAT